MSPAVLDQIVLWVIGACATCLGIILLAIGKWIVNKIERVQVQVQTSREQNTQEMNAIGAAMRHEMATLRHEFSSDLALVRERLARVEGAAQRQSSGPS